MNRNLDGPQRPYALNLQSNLDTTHVRSTDMPDFGLSVIIYTGGVEKLRTSGSNIFQRNKNLLATVVVGATMFAIGLAADERNRTVIQECTTIVNS